MAALVSSSVAVFEPSRCCKDSFDFGSSGRAASSRVKSLKRRYAGIIEKAKKALADADQSTSSKSTETHHPSAAASQKCCTKRAVDTEKMRMRRNEMELERTEQRRKEEIQKKREAARRTKIEPEEEIQKKREAARREIQKKREAARKEIEQMGNTAPACEDTQKVMRDFEKLIGYNEYNAASANRHISLTPYGSNTLLFEFAEETILKGSARCWDKYVESCSQRKTTTNNCGGRLQNNGEELEEGEIAV